MTTKLPGLRLVKGSEFHQHFTAARARMGPREAACLTEYTSEDFSRMRCLVAADGKVGGAVKPGDPPEAVSLFNQGGPRGAGGAMLDHLVRLGARQLDCVDDPLRVIYEARGFHIVAMLDWDWRYAPPGWLKEWGEPSIYVMRIQR